MRSNRFALLTCISLAVCLLFYMPAQLKADYAPDGIAALWWTARVAPDALPPSVVALDADWQIGSFKNGTTWSRRLPTCPVGDPALVIANLNASHVEVLLDNRLIYSFGSKTGGVGRAQAANAVHWIAIPAEAQEGAVQIRAYTVAPDSRPIDLPMILYAASTPLMRHLQRAAAGRIALALLFVFVGIYAGLAWLVRRRYGMRVSPWLAALSFSLGLGLLISAMMEFMSPDASARIYYIGLLMILLFPAALWRFMETSLGAGPVKLIRRCWQLQLLSAGLLWLPDFLGIRAFGTSAQLVGNSVLALQLGVGAWVGIHYMRIGDTSQKWIAFGIFLLSVSGLVDIAGAILIGDPTFELYPFGALALVLVLAYVQERAAGEAQRLLRRQAEALHRHQTHLEELVETRTAQLRESTKAAQAASQAKSDFLANMSHELRTPLNAILGHAQLLRSEAEASADVAARGNIIRESGEYLLALINDILDLARIESGRLDINIGEVDLAELLAGIVDMLKPRAEQKSLSFSLTQTTSIPGIVMIDGRRLRQILLNLVGNAIKFTDEGSVRIAVAYRGDKLYFTVRDTGPGMRDDDVSRLFESFEQGADAVSREGTGLGLSISRRLVQRMEGDIGVNSKLGEGSEFWFHIPCEAVSGSMQPVPDTSSVLAQAQPFAPCPGNMHPDYKTLIEAARIGDLATVKTEISFLKQRHPQDQNLLAELEKAAARYDIDQLQKYLSL